VCSYVGAGTVEFMFEPATNKFYFLELNPRLQVEHPVTEGLTGINLPSVILQTAMGVPLQHILDVRRFFGAVDKTDVVDFDGPLPAVDTHVIAARITAENPDDGFKPCGGRVDRISIDQWSQVSFTHKPTHARAFDCCQPTTPQTHTAEWFIYPVT
jgi:acetyl-CoA carboxylase/biotin carboxylase 1